MKPTFLNRMGLYTGSQLRTRVAQSSNGAQRMFWASNITRLDQDLTAFETQIDSDIRTGGKALRGRVRNICINNDYARRFVRLYITNVVGPRGHNFQSNVTELVEVTQQDPETKKMKTQVKRMPDVVSNLRIKDSWDDFTKPGNCSIDGLSSYAAITKLLALYKVRDGEAFLYRVIDPTAPWGIRLQVIPPEVVDDYYNLDLGNGRQIVMGVELDENRRPVAYWFRKQTPLQSSFWSIYSGERIRVPAENIIHWYSPEYANQTRGFSRFVSSLKPLHYIDQYEKASTRNATFGAFKAGFFGNKNPEVEENLANAVSPDGQSDNGAGGTDIVINADALSFQDIGNKEFYQWDPKYPTMQHEMFVRTTLRGIAAGLGCSYSSLANDYSQANYSSEKASTNTERKMWKDEQENMIETVQLRVFGWWLEAALMTGKLGLPYTKKSKFFAPVFLGPTWPFVDPQKDGQANQLAIRTFQRSIYDVVAENGENLEDIIRDFAAARDFAKQYGIDLDTALAAATVRQTGQTPPAPPETQPAGAPTNDSTDSEE